MKKRIVFILILSAAVFIMMCAAGCHLVQKIHFEKGDSDETEAATDLPTEELTESSFTGFITEEGVRRYYLNGELQTNAVVGDDTDGYFYVGKDGGVDDGYCDGVTVDGVDWIIIEGEAYEVQTESDKCLFAAAKDVAACTTTDMTREEKLKACFDYIRSNYGEGVQHDPPYPASEPDWAIIYANDIFVKGRGDCYSFGAAYAYMARAIGYIESYACNSTGHGWTEIEERTYDPEWSMHSNNYSYYAMKYDEPCDVPYAKALSFGKEYKRLQILIHG